LPEEFKDIYGDIYVESVSGGPLRECGVYMWLLGLHACVAGERDFEGEGGGGGAGREKQPLVKTAQKHSVDKHSTPIDPDTTSKKL